MAGTRVAGGTVHKTPPDLREMLTEHDDSLAIWKDITPLARNEWICWVEDAKQEQTCAKRIERARQDLAKGKRRPCCWPGCSHRDRNGK